MKKVSNFFSGYKTYIGSWVVLTCGFVAIYIAIYMKYDSREFWDFMKYMFGFALAGIGVIGAGIRNAQNKTHKEVVEVLGRMERGRGEAERTTEKDRKPKAKAKKKTKVAQ